MLESQKRFSGPNQALHYFRIMSAGITVYIRTMIRQFMASDDITMCDDTFEPVPRETVSSLFKAVSSYLQKNTKTGDVVAINFPYGYRYHICMLACMDAGVTYVPLRPSWPQARIRQIDDLARFAITIDASTLPDILATPVGKANERQVMAHDRLYLLFTSGSTGEPKGVIITRAAFENYLKWVSEFFKNCGCDDRLLMTADFTFDASLFDTALMLTRGVAVGYSQFDGLAYRLASDIAKFRATLLSSVANNVTTLLHDSVLRRYSLDSLRVLMLGGSRFPVSTYRSIFTKFKKTPAVYNLYGPTENTVDSHAKKLVGDEGADVVNGVVSVGKPISGVSCHLIDDNCQIIEMPHKLGQLVIGGAQLMAGYFARDAETAKAIIIIGNQPFFTTGDLAFCNAEGDYFISGRLDETIKTRGFRVNLLDIDAYIQKLPQVVDSASVAYRHEGAENLIASYVIAEPGVGEEELRKAMSSVLVSYQIPAKLILVRELPLNNAGKICRKSLAEKARTEYEAP